MGWHTNTWRPGLIGGLIVLLLAPLLAAQETRPAESVQGQAAAIVPMVGHIDDYSSRDFIRRFNKARGLGAKVIIISINSPGGGVGASMEISRFLKRQTDVHTVAFVKDMAYSGASMVAVACNEIWMAPESVLGDCAPILLVKDTGELEALPPTERAKQESPVVDEFLDSARHNGYDPLLLTAMVTLRDPVMVVRDDKGKLRVIREADYHALAAEAEWKPAPGFENVSGARTLVTVRPGQAAALGLSRGEAGSPHEVADQLHVPLIADLTPGWGEQLVEFFNNPFVRMILLTIFLQSLYIALTAPGHGAAEAVAMVTLGLLIGIPLLTGLAQWWEVAIIFGGLALVAFEIFGFPGHFVSLIVGTLMVVIGLVMTFVPSGLPGWTPNAPTVWHGVQTGLLAVVGAMICWFFLTMWLRRYLPSIPYFNKLILTATTGNTNTLRPVGEQPPHSEPWPFVGTIGVAATDLRPGGAVEFPYADTSRPAAVVSATGYVPRGTKVVVEEIQGSSVRVRAVG